MVFEIPETDVWVSYDADFVKRMYAERVGKDISDDEAQSILEALESQIVAAMSDAGYEVICNYIDNTEE